MVVGSLIIGKRRKRHASQAMNVSNIEKDSRDESPFLLAYFIELQILTIFEDVTNLERQ